MLAFGGNGRYRISMRKPVIHIVVAVLLDIAAALLVLSTLGTVASTAQAAAAGLPTIPPLATVLPTVGIAAVFIYLSVGLYSRHDWARRVAAGQAWTAVGVAVIGAAGLAFVGGTAGSFAEQWTAPGAPVALGIGIGVLVTLLVFGGIPLLIAYQLNRPDMQDLTENNPGQLSRLSGIPIPAAVLFYLAALGGIGSLLQIPGAVALPRLASQLAAVEPGRTLGDLSASGLDQDTIDALQQFGELPFQLNPFEFIPPALPAIVLLAFGTGLLASAYLMYQNRRPGVWTFAGIQAAGAIMILTILGFARSMLGAVTAALASSGVQLNPGGPGPEALSRLGDALSRSLVMVLLVALSLLALVVVLTLRSSFGRPDDPAATQQASGPA